MLQAVLPALTIPQSKAVSLLQKGYCGLIRKVHWQNSAYRQVLFYMDCGKGQKPLTVEGFKIQTILSLVKIGAVRLTDNFLLERVRFELTDLGRACIVSTN
jgi:hypothetical protein